MAVLHNRSWSECETKLSHDRLAVVNFRIVSQIMVLWYKLGLEVLYRQRSNEFVRQRLALFLSSCLLFWPLFDRSQDCWSWRLNTVVPISLMGRLIYKVSCVELLRLLGFVSENKTLNANLLVAHPPGCCTQRPRGRGSSGFFSFRGLAFRTLIRSSPMDGMASLLGIEPFHGMASRRDGGGRLSGGFLAGSLHGS